jgi:hypothetical protein
MNNIAITIDPYLEQLVQHQACSYAIFVQQGSQSIVTNPIVFDQANASRIGALKLKLFLAYEHVFPCICFWLCLM